MIYFFHVLFDCNLLEINISYSFGDIKGINLLCQQPPAWLIVTLIMNNSQPKESVFFIPILFDRH